MQNDDDKDQEKVKEGNRRKKRKVLEREETFLSLVPPNLDAGPSKPRPDPSVAAYVNPKDCEQKSSFQLDLHHSIFID